jgi:hypothetical protein
MDAVALHALNKDREARYQSAAAFRADLQSVRLGRRISDAALGTAAGARGCRRHAATHRAAWDTNPPRCMPRSPVRGPAPAEPVRALSVRAPSVRALSVRVPGVLAGVARERQPAAPGRPEQPATPRPSPAVREGRDRQPDRRGTWAILTIAGLIALALLGWGLNSYLDNQAQETAMVTVPSVTGEPRATAQAKITRAGLTPEVTTENSKTVPADHVISQDPEGAVRVPRAGRSSSSSPPDRRPSPSPIWSARPRRRPVRCSATSG